MENLKTLEILKMAILMEKRGHAFYSQVASQTKSFEIKKTIAGDIEKQAVSEGMITMKQDGYMKAGEGVTSIEEVLRVVSE